MNTSGHHYDSSDYAITCKRCQKLDDDYATKGITETTPGYYHEYDPIESTNDLPALGGYRRRSRKGRSSKKKRSSRKRRSLKRKLHRKRRSSRK